MKSIFAISATFLVIFSALAGDRSPKRGICGDASPEDLAAFAPYVTWYYDWGVQPPSVTKGNLSGIEWVPMQWGALSADKVSDVASRIPEGSRFLLGFNEPNFKSQANITPEKAAAMWPNLEKIADEQGLGLVSPAVNWCGDCVDGVTNDPTDWLDKFISACPECRFDYIAVHNYNSYVNTLKSYLDKFRKYGKPLWLTEFAPWDDPVDFEGVMKYMKEAIPYLESEPLVYRYSWFATRVKSNPDIDLLGENGTLTKLGQLYAMLPFEGDSTPGGNAPLVILPGQISASLSSGKTSTSVKLRGSVYYQDSSAVTLEWSQIAGPTNAKFSSSTVTDPTISDLQIGVYLFQLKASVNDKSDSAGITVRVNPANIAKNKPASASSEQGENTASKVNDGDMSTRWSSLDSDPQWIRIDLEEVHVISGSRIVWETAYAEEYTIDVSSDGSSWKTVYTTTNGTGGTSEHQLNAAGRHIRMNATRRVSQEKYWGNSIFEFEVYGSPVSSVNTHRTAYNGNKLFCPDFCANYLSLEFPKHSIKSRLEIFTCSGRRVFSEVVNANQLRAVIDARSLEPGAYFIKFHNEKKTYCKRVIRLR